MELSVVSPNCHDNANRLTNITHQTAAGGTIASYAYTLDAASRLTQEARTWNGGAAADTLTYTYTDNNQLTGVAHTNGAFANESFSYDATGNRTMAGYTTQAGNELTSDGTFNYAYDNEGNLITKTEIATGNQTLYTYDFHNRLTEVDQVISGVHSVLAQYTYDALGRQIKVVEGGSTRWTAYDGTSPVLDFNGSGAVTARYLNGPTPVGVDAVLARETSSGGVAWYLADRLGTVRDLADNTGAVIDHVDYMAYGQVVGETAPAVGDRFKYAGMELDSATGLNHDGVRFYDPLSGRFISRDPLGFAPGDENLYRYVASDPTDGIDPTGFDADFYLGGQPYVWPWHWTPSWSGAANTLDSYQYTTRVTVACGLGGTSGGATSGGTLFGLAGLRVGGPALGLEGLQVGVTTGGVLGGLWGLWGGLTAPPGATPGEALQEGYYEGLTLGPLGPVLMPGGLPSLPVRMPSRPPGPVRGPAPAPIGRPPVTLYHQGDLEDGISGVFWARPSSDMGEMGSDLISSYFVRIREEEKILDVSRDRHITCN